MLTEGPRSNQSGQRAAGPADYAFLLGGQVETEAEFWELFTQLHHHDYHGRTGSFGLRGLLTCQREICRIGCTTPSRHRVPSNRSVAFGRGLGADGGRPRGGEGVRGNDHVPGILAVPDLRSVCPAGRLHDSRWSSMRRTRVAGRSSSRLGALPSLGADQDQQVERIGWRGR